MKCFVPGSGNCVSLIVTNRGRDSSVSIAMDYRLDGRGSILGRGKIFLFSTAPRPGLGSTQSSIQWVQGAISPGSEADRSLLFSVEVKNGVAIPPLPHTSSWRSA
jgi:hypothetical protein